MIDYIDLGLKFLTMFFLAGASQMAFKNRQWGSMIITFGLWLTVFRAAILKSATLYVGVFNHTPPEVVRLIQTSLMTGWPVVITDSIALIASFLGFVFFTGSDIQRALDKKKLKVKK